MFLLKVINLRNEIERECGILVPNELIFEPFYGGASFTFTKHFPSVVKVTLWSQNSGNICLKKNLQINSEKINQGILVEMTTIIDSSSL